MITPEASTTFSAWLLLGPAVVAGFFLCGHLAFRWLHSEQALATSFVAAGLLLFFAVLVGDFCQVALTREYLTLMLGAAALVGWLVSKRLRSKYRCLMMDPQRISTPDWRSEMWWLIPVAIMTISMVVRWTVDPQSGFDTIFRWDYLARLMADQQSLAHYPPVTAADFAAYPWSDGIPPMAPVMGLWLYLSTGSSAEIIGGVRWLIEFGLTLAMVWQISRRLWDVNGAKVSLLILSTSSLFLSSIAMGQETGLTGIALLTVTALLFDYRETPRTATAVWIGLAAGFCGLCRDYNLIFLPVILGLLALARPRQADWWLAAAAMAATVAPWYLRNAWITGNPLFPHALGGLFCSNDAHQQFMRDVFEFWSLFAPRWSILGYAKCALIGTGALLFAALPSLKLDQFEGKVLAALMITSAALWLTSVSLTAGGWVYSLRVLGPMLPLLAIVGGGSTRLVKGRWRVAAAVLCALLAIDAARRSWIYITFPDIPALPYTWREWRNWDLLLRTQRASPLWKILISTAQGEGVVTDHPNFFVLGRRFDGNMISMFSPQVEPLWRDHPSLSLSSLQQALRKRGIRFVALSGAAAGDMYFYKSAPGVQKLLAIEPTVKAGGLSFYDLALPLSKPAP